MQRFRQLPVSWTTIAPAACAIHCAATPILVAVAPTMVREAAVEWTLLGVTLALAAFVLSHGVRTHGALLPLALTTVGMALWAASLLDVFQPVPEDVSTPIAALTAAGGFMWNARMHRRDDGGACDCTCCSDG